MPLTARAVGEVAIVPLAARHVAPLVQLHAAEPADYHRYFSPFPFDMASWETILQARVRDLYFAVTVGAEVAGFYMLRGFDQGYAIPAYGVWIGQRYSGQGLATATLHHAVATCEALGCATLMLKVHPENQRARALYERFGFYRVGADPRNKNWIYHLALPHTPRHEQPAVSPVP